MNVPLLIIGIVGLCIGCWVHGYYAGKLKEIDRTLEMLTRMQHDQDSEPGEGGGG